MRYHELIEDEFAKVQADYKSQQMKDIEKGAILIKRDCQPYLSQVQDPMKLRRGVKRDYDADSQTGRPMFNKRKSHLAGRNPRGSWMQKWHPVVNDYFTAEFGLPFRNGIMTTGDQMQSSHFGTDVAVFPIGEFKFLWSPEVTDINHQFRAGNWDIQDSKQRLLNALESANYQTTDLQAAIDSKNEIMIWAESYYTLDNNADRLLVKKLLK
jgi:hypothetical protein